MTQQEFRDIHMDFWHMNVWRTDVRHMSACRMRDCWMALMFKQRCCTRACNRSIFSKREMGFSKRKMGLFLLSDILRGEIQWIIATKIYKALQRNPCGVICTPCLWKQNLNEERETQIILLNFILNSRLNVHVLCRHSYSRFYCAGRGARRDCASRACGGDCGRYSAIVECGGGQSSRGANGNRIGDGEIASGAIYGRGNSAPLADAGENHP